MIHPHTFAIRINIDIGLGVVATEPIPRGTLVWVQDRFDRVVPRESGLLLDAAHRSVLDRFGRRDGRGNWLLCWDTGHLINHACEPTVRALGPSMLVSRRDLWPGDQLTCDYAEYNLEHPMECACGSENCRGVIRDQDRECYRTHWELESLSLVKAARTVPQPLFRFAVDHRGAEHLRREHEATTPWSSNVAFVEDLRPTVAPPCRDS